MLRRPLAVGLACSALLLTGSALRPAVASHSTVTAVQGSAFGYWADEISLFGGAQADTGPTPTVSLAPDASNSPQSAAAPSGLVAYGPATLFTSDTITISSSGGLGTTGSASTTSSIDNINKSTTQPTVTGSEVFTADNVSGTATADATGTSGSATVVNGTVNTHHQASQDCTSLTLPCGRAGEEHTHGLANPDGVVGVPTNPPPNYKVAGHLHLGNTTTDYFVIVFNEQVVNPDGSITVNPVHEYYGYKLDGSGNIVQDKSYAQGGSILHGHLYLGQVTAGVSTGPATEHDPVAVDDAYATDYETTLDVPAPGVLANDTDEDGGTLTAHMPTGPSNGTLVLNTDGSFTYTPNAGFSGADSFTYMAHDPEGNMSNTATVTITVGPPPPPPVADVRVGDITDSPDPVAPAGTVTYTVPVTNDGLEGATGVTLFSSMSKGASITSASSSAGTCEVVRGKNKGWNCDLGSMDAGTTQTVTVTVTAPRKPAPITLTATVSSTSDDPDLTNNSASEDTDVVRP